MVAREAGFTDQAHLVREFRALLGETPGAFAARAGR
jgi:AraC-like DNA-binding protein